jgi:hypothetical protein
MPTHDSVVGRSGLEAVKSSRPSETRLEPGLERDPNLQIEILFQAPERKRVTSAEASTAM